MIHALIMAATLIAPASAPQPLRLDQAEALSLVGTWEGFLKPTPLVEFRLIFRVESKDGVIRATAETPDLEPNPLVEFDSTSLHDGVAVFVCKAIDREFRGKYDPKAHRIVGDWKKGATKTPLTIDKLDGPAVPSEVWEGKIELPGGVGLAVNFHLGKLRDGTPRGTMDSPSQGAIGLKLDTVARDKETLNLAVKSIGGDFSGKFDSDGTSAVGKWTQGGMAMPLTLKKVDKLTEAKRTQMPKPPFPYSTEEVAYDSKAPGVRIAGTLTIPPGPGPFPAVLLITGSGAQDRDESLLGHKPFLVLADALTRRGVLVLRVDDRGTGKSTGNFGSSTTFDFADDAQAGFHYLKGRKQVAPGKVGLVGHSEGGLIAPIVAARTPEVSFIVLLAGPGLPGGDILLAQQALILKASGVPEDKIKESTAIPTRMIAIIKETPDPKAAETKLKAANDEAMTKLPEAERKAMAESDPNGTALARLTTPWFRTFLDHDPRPTLGKVRCPVLALNGELDLQVPCKDNIEAIRQAITSGGNARLTARALPGLNHLFQTCKTGAPSEYAEIEETFTPEALKIIGDWIIDQAGQR